MLENIRDVLQILKDYIVYIYPGLISVFVYNYLGGKKVQENSIIVVKSITISYLYIVFLQYLYSEIFEIKIDNNLKNDDILRIVPHIIILIVSIVFPIILYKIINAKWFERLQKKMKITTRRESNPIEIALSKEEKTWICVYMDGLGVMYEGYIRNYVKDVDRMTYLMLSQYKISKLNEQTNIYEQTYPVSILGRDDKVTKKDWVILYFEHITRIEIVYRNEH